MLMAEHKRIYRNSFTGAQRNGELEQWRGSQTENIACRDFIAQSIAMNYDGYRLGGQVAEQAIAKFGFDRVNLVLANTVQLKEYDGRFSQENKDWAKGIFIAEDDPHRRAFLIDDAHPGLVDMVVRDARQAYEQSPEPMRIKVYQINAERDAAQKSFTAHKPGQQIDPSIYDEVYDGLVADPELEAIFQQFNISPPPLHRGASMSVGDVVEIGGEHHYVNPIGFEKIDFDAAQTQKPDNLLRVVVVEPGLPAYEGEIGPDLQSMQRAVGGLIEITCPFADDAVVVGNDEAKLIGMQGNRHIAGQVYAGPLFIAGDDGGGELCSLTDEQAAAYCGIFAQPEDISMEETQADMGFIVYGFE